MAKELTTGVLIHKETVEWTALSGSGARRSVERQGRFVMALPEDGEADASAESGAEARAQQIRSECAPIRGPVSLALPSDELLLRVVSLPTSDPVELQGMVELQLDKISPFPTENMVVSYELLDERDGTALVMIAAARTEIVDDAAALLQPAGIEPVRVDAAVLGWWRLVQDSGMVEPEGRHVFVLLDGRVPEVLVVEGGVPITLRSLGAYENMTTPEFASDMAGEISYTLMSVELEHGAGAPQSVRVWYREEPPNLERELRAELACDVELHALAELGTVSEGIARRLAERGAGRLDLTPGSWRAAKAQQRFRRRMWGGVVSLLAVWLAVVGGFFGWMAYERNRVAALTDLRDQWRQPALEVREMRRRVFAIRRYMDTSRSALECLREVSMLQPPGIDLTTFNYYQDEDLTVAGEADDVNRVYEFKTRLDGSGLFTGSTLQGPRLDARKGKQIFEIELDLPGEDA